ncbi:MAG: class I SAM-dependent methyltransferase [Candidatus Aenigmarchaeota archaeon]|nr:class I SAM-dependent methyltransferase [Candidatus Aenigmarchaeota archaeon]
MNIQSYWRKRSKNLLAKGKISYLNPDKIERQSILTSLINAKKYARGRLLDMGCGNKSYESIFPDVVKHIGVDLPISESANKLEKQADVYGSVLELPFNPNSFDTVLSTQVLEHVPEPKRMLKEAYRVLKREGYLILTAPMTWGLHEIPNDYYRYTKYGLKYLAESVGFEIVYIKARCGFWGAIGQRISSWVYYFRGTPKSIIGEGIKRILCGMVQAFYFSLDKISKDEGETLGYIMVAKKR